MTIYLDESGDLGFGSGGSKYFVISFIVTNNPDQIKRVVRDAKIKFNLPTNYEIKGSGTTPRVKNYLLQRLAQTDIEIHAIVMNKLNVYERLRSDENILYNYVLGLVLVPCLVNTGQQKVSIVVDKRIVSVTSGFKLDEYLKYKVWYENLKDVDMSIHHEDSKYTLGIQAVDVISNSIYRKYEIGDETYYNVVKSLIKENKKLFF